MQGLGFMLAPCTPHSGVIPSRTLNPKPNTNRSLGRDLRIRARRVASCATARASHSGKTCQTWKKPKNLAHTWQRAVPLHFPLTYYGIPSHLWKYYLRNRYLTRCCTLDLKSRINKHIHRRYHDKNIRNTTGIHVCHVWRWRWDIPFKIAQFDRVTLRRKTFKSRISLVYYSCPEGTKVIIKIK